MKLIKIGIYTSILWVIFATFIYVDNLVHYPKSYVEYFQISYIYDCFGKEEDLDRKEDALAYAKSNGKELEAQMLLNFGFKFVKPIFSKNGYLKLIFLPIIFMWGLIFLRKRRKSKDIDEINIYS